ncbi:PAS domain-containing protein, partial [Thermodesulfobacteriota bacterium]
MASSRFDRSGEPHIRCNTPAAERPGAATIFHDETEPGLRHQDQARSDPVTEKKETAAAPSSSSACWHSRLFNRVPCAFLLLDGDGCVTDCNNNAASLIRLSRTSLIGRRATDFVTPHFLPAFRESSPTMPRIEPTETMSTV